MLRAFVVGVGSMTTKSIIIKETMCVFGKKQIKYLRHIISEAVVTYSTKIQSVLH